VSFGGGKGQLLISPLGLFPGFLYTALRETESDVCLVVASKESKENLDIIKRRSGYHGSIVEKIMDAHQWLSRNQRSARLILEMSS